MSTPAYLRHPTISDDLIVFVAEDDLWSVGASGGTAHRITANPGSITRPRLSPDAARIAYISRDEGVRDAWVMNVDGSDATRLSYFGSAIAVAGWSEDGSEIIVVSDHDQPFPGFTHLWSVPLDGGPTTKLPVGHAWSMARLRSGGLALGRNAFDPARWKRYRGGRTGQLWIDRTGDGEFETLVPLSGNLADPMAIGSRVAFLSDHEGIGNLYSVTPTGRNLERLTTHDDFYVRFPSSDGRRIVYHAGADLHVYDPAAGESMKLQVSVPSSRPIRNRRFIGPGRFVESFELHPKGHSLALDIRGFSFTMPLWEGTPIRHTSTSAVRNRLTAWTPDGERIVSVSDASSEERLVIRPVGAGAQESTIDADVGRVRSLDVAPAVEGLPDRAAITNHRHEVSIIDLDSGEVELVHASPYLWIGGTAWSPDGRWLAFCARRTETTQELFLYDTREARLSSVGDGHFVDHRPSFDPDGEFLFFLSSRVLDPVSDSVFHDYGFPTSVLAMILPLRAGTPVPYRLASSEPRSPGENGKSDDNVSSENTDTEFDLEGMADRLEALPLAAGRHVQLVAASGRVLILTYPVRGALGTPSIDPVPSSGVLSMIELSTGKQETVAEEVRAFDVSADGKSLAIWSGKKLRVVNVGWKESPTGKDSIGRDTGLVDLGRIRIEVDPGDEWRQMFSEAWRLQRDQFWSEDMTGVDWLEVHDRYAALIDRVATRSEFSDLLWEMQGELGTSHAYELGGEYRPEPKYTLGRLGADIEWSRGAWRVTRIPIGDSWDPKARSPLTRAGVEVSEKDRIRAVDGVDLDRSSPPESLLVDRGGRTVALEVSTGRKRSRTVVVEPLASETALRYRDWVETNRRVVRAATGGRGGYIHIPDMGAPGFAEFHRAWRHEVVSDGLVVDVRFNRGGNVSQLLLQKLVRERLGYRVMRWSVPRPFPSDAPAGPMVCLTNEFSGSDGDIFSHTFKMHGLGPLIGTRTWGGVVGIWPQQSLVDGTVTTQPEFGTWFNDVEFAVENYGTDPDIEVVIAPHDYGLGRDPQLDRAIEELQVLVDADSIDPPDFTTRPSTRSPRLS